MRVTNVKKPDYYKSRQRENGIALFMSLVMLLIITVLGLSSVQTTTLQERMARNARDTALAFQAAESALKDAEIRTESFTSLSVFDAADANSQGYYYEADYDDPPNWVGVNWDTAGGNYRTAETNIVGVAVQPKYIIEYVKAVVAIDDSLNLNNIGQDTGSGRPSRVFRITVYGTGGTEVAHVMLQSTYGKRF